MQTTGLDAKEKREEEKHCIRIPGIERRQYTKERLSFYVNTSLQHALSMCYPDLKLHEKYPDRTPEN